MFNSNVIKHFTPTVFFLDKAEFNDACSLREKNGNFDRKSVVSVILLSRERKKYEHAMGASLG